MPLHCRPGLDAGHYRCSKLFSLHRQQCPRWLSPYVYCSVYMYYFLCMYYTKYPKLLIIYSEICYYAFVFTICIISNLTYS